MTWLRVQGFKFAGTLQWTVDAWVNFLEKGGGEKKRLQYCLNPYSSKHFLYFRAIQGHSRGNFVDPLLQDNELLQDDFTEYIYHIGNAFEMHSIFKSGLIPGGKASQGTGSQCSSQPWTRWMLDKIWKKLNTIWTNPEWHRINTLGKFTSILVQFEAYSQKGIAILSNSITCNYSFKHTASDLYRKSGMHENWWRYTAKYISHPGYLVLHLCRTRNTVGEEHKHRETCISSRVDFRIRGIPHSNVEQVENSQRNS